MLFCSLHSLRSLSNIHETRTRNSTYNFFLVLLSLHSSMVFALSLLSVFLSSIISGLPPVICSSVSSFLLSIIRSRRSPRYTLRLASRPLFSLIVPSIFFYYYPPPQHACQNTNTSLILNVWHIAAFCLHCFGVVCFAFTQWAVVHERVFLFPFIRFIAVICCPVHVCPYSLCGFASEHSSVCYTRPNVHGMYALALAHNPLTANDVVLLYTRGYVTITVSLCISHQFWLSRVESHIYA